MPFELQESFAIFFLMAGFRLGFVYARGGLVGETYEWRSVSSWELSRRMVEPLFGILVGVFLFGVVE